MSYKEQIMSKDKYPSIFSPQMEDIVFIILQIYYATRAVLKIGEYPRIFPSFGWGIFTHVHVTRSDQSRASENICWIIVSDITGVRSTCNRKSEFRIYFNLYIVGNERAEGKTGDREARLDRKLHEETGTNSNP